MSDAVLISIVTTVAALITGLIFRLLDTRANKVQKTIEFATAEIEASKTAVEIVTSALDVANEELERVRKQRDRFREERNQALADLHRCREGEA